MKLLSQKENSIIKGGDRCSRLLNRLDRIASRDYTFKRAMRYAKQYDKANEACA